MMSSERKKEALQRTECVLVRHLEDLNDEIDQEGGRIKDHMVLDGIKDALKSMRCIKELMAEDKAAEGDEGSESEPETPVAAKSKL